VRKKRSVSDQTATSYLAQNGAHNPYHTLNTITPVIWDRSGNAQRKVSAEIVSQNRTKTVNEQVHEMEVQMADNQSSQHSLMGNNKYLAIRKIMHLTLVKLLENGSVMTKYPSIHTEKPDYLAQVSHMKAKPKLVRISNDWQTIEFHNIPQQMMDAAAATNEQQQQILMKVNKPPKVLPISNMKSIDSSFSDHIQNQRVFSKSRHSSDLLIFALDKNGKEIVIKLVCQNLNDTRRWTRALIQIITYFQQR